MSGSGIYQTRSEVAKEARDRRLRGWFEKRRWRVMTEMSGERRKNLPCKPGEPQQVASIRYDQGEFWYTSPQGVFQTPFGYKGRHGFLIVELDPETGNDLSPRNVVAFGHAVLAKAQDLWKCFPDGLPAERKHPPRSA